MDRTRVTSGATVVMVAILAVLIIETPQPPPGIVVPQREDPAIPVISRNTTTSARPTDLGAVSPNTQAPSMTRPNPTPPSQPKVPTVPAVPKPGPSTITSEPEEPPEPVPPFLTVSCPNPAIGWVLPGARAEVSTQLAELDCLIDEANDRLRALTSVPDPRFIQNTILGPLTDRRIATLDRIAIAIGRFGPRPQGLQRFARCEIV